MESNCSIYSIPDQIVEHSDIINMWNNVGEYKIKTKYGNIISS